LLLRDTESYPIYPHDPRVPLRVQVVEVVLKIIYETGIRKLIGFPGATFDYVVKVSV